MAFFNKLYIDEWIVPRYLGYVLTHLVEALCYKPAGCGFNSWWGHWDFSL